MIINNLTRDNHLKKLIEISQSAEKIFIISPYLTTNIKLFKFENLKNLKKVIIITTLKPYDLDQYSKVTYFKQLYQIFNKMKVDFEIMIENSLHGKIFITENNFDTFAIITSANFTDNGLRINNEWGILIDNYNEINKIKDGIISKIEYDSLNEQSVDIFIAQMVMNPKPQIAKSPIKLNLSSLFNLKANLFNITPKATFWLKPIGFTKNHVPLTEKFDIIDTDLHFAKKPSGIKKGDIIISFAIGHLKILSIYEVNSAVQKINGQNQRWPYFIVGKNLTPYYGGEWSIQNFTINNQRQIFLAKGTFNITPSGKNSYGSFNQSADKLQLTKEYGMFLLNQISVVDKKLRKV
jgi:HKD family nuclease